MLLPLLLFGTAIGVLLYPKKTAMNDTVNNSYDPIFKKYASQYGLDWKMLKRISWIESKIGTYPSVRRGVENPKDIQGSVSQDKKSWGIMQVTLVTAGDYDKQTSAEKLNDVDYSIKIASQHLSFLKKRYFPSSERDLVMSYNHGQGNQLKFIASEKAGTLLASQYPAGRDYYKKYLYAKGLIP